ncbi:MAG: hypothetical protein EXS10_01755 [Phycisphaerales bacterium]|nr:hypothetical protein [Phycisphaerales bacterium]
MRFSRWICLVALLFPLSLASHLTAQDAAALSVTPPPRFMRSESFGKFAAFETIALAYQRADHTGPIVWLVGAVHVGDAKYYERLEQFLDGKDLVLFESVLPRGAFGAFGATDSARARSTQDAMLFLRGILERYAREKGGYPASLADARAFATSEDSRLSRPVELSRTDAWGHALRYSASADEYALASWGSDGCEGGTGAALDLVLHARADLRAPALSKDMAKSPQHRKPKGDLYKDLADALGVSLQVKEMCYDKANWTPADLPLESVLDRLDAKGVRSATVEMLTREDSLLNTVVRFGLAMASKLPDFKRIVIEALGSAGAGVSNTSAGAEEGKDESSVIIGERNRAVLDRLRMELDVPSPPRSIAIFYGAAHMAQFDERLLSEFGMTRLDDSLRTFRAMETGELSLAQLRAQLTAAEAAYLQALTWTAESGGKKPSPKRMASLEQRVKHFTWRVDRAQTNAVFSDS